jgi:hypothetical protein
MDTRCLTRSVREQTGSGTRNFAVRAASAGRNPMLLLRLSALFLFRLDDRKFSGLLFQEPPRITRWPSLGLLLGKFVERRNQPKQQFVARLNCVGNARSHYYFTFRSAR